MSKSLNSFKGVMQGTIIGGVKGDTRTLDYSSYCHTFLLFAGYRVPRKVKNDIVNYLGPHGRGKTLPNHCCVCFWGVPNIRGLLYTEYPNRVPVCFLIS